MFSLSDQNQRRSIDVCRSLYTPHGLAVYAHNRMHWSCDMQSYSLMTVRHGAICSLSLAYTENMPTKYASKIGVKGSLYRWYNQQWSVAYSIHSDESHAAYIVYFSSKNRNWQQRHGMHNHRKQAMWINHSTYFFLLSNLRIASQMHVWPTGVIDPTHMLHCYCSFSIKRILTLIERDLKTRIFSEIIRRLTAEMTEKSNTLCWPATISNFTLLCLYQRRRNRGGKGGVRPLQCWIWGV